MNNEARLLNAALKLIKTDKHKEAADMLAASGIETPLVLFQTALCRIETGELDKAEEALKRHIAEEPSKDALDVLLTVYIMQKDNDSAYSAAERLLKKDADNERALIYYAACLGDREFDGENIPVILKFADRYLENSSKWSMYPVPFIISALLNCYRAAVYVSYIELGMRCFDAVRALLPKDKRDMPLYLTAVRSVLSFAIYSDHYSDDELTEMIREMHDLCKPAHVNEFVRDTSLFRELRIGFLSSDLFFHPVGRFLVALFADANPNSRIAYYSYDTGDKPREGEITDAIKDRCAEFRYIGDLSDDDAEEIILKDELDILFDLNGVSRGNKCYLVMRRLAQIQFTWIGFPCTSAAQNVDYCLVDPVTDPPEYAAKFYTEELAYMQKTFLCYPLVFYHETAFILTDPPFVKNGYITFGSFNNAAKYTPRALAVWDRILRRLPSARLVIVSGTVKDDVTRNALRGIFGESGIDMSRVDLREPKGYDEYLPMYNGIDIILDTFPFNGATTTCDAFVMGVPVVTLTGVKHWERVGLSMLKHVGLEDLAASSEDGYVEAAVTLAGDTDRLLELKYTLRERLESSPLADTAAFKIEFENLMRRLFIKYCIENRSRQKPKSETDLFTETVCGLSFFEHMTFGGVPFDIVTRAKNEIAALQNRFIKTLGDNADTAKYKTANAYLAAARGTEEIRQLADACTKLLAVCTRGREYQ